MIASLIAYAAALGLAAAIPGPGVAALVGQSMGSGLKAALFLAQKAAYLLQTGLCPEPKRILAISFKRDAAQNLAARVRQRCPADQARRFHSMTFDAFTKHMLDHFPLAIPNAYRPPADYRIAFPSPRDLEFFLRRHGRQDISADRFERAVARTPLPLEETVENVRARELLRAYWDDQYAMPDGALVSFAMINRLIEYMLRANPKIKRALRLTYPFVFLDEFQDTTYAQYSLGSRLINFRARRGQLRRGLWLRGRRWGTCRIGSQPAANP